MLIRIQQIRHTHCRAQLLPQARQGCPVELAHPDRARRIPTSAHLGTHRPLHSLGGCGGVPRVVDKLLIIGLLHDEHELHIDRSNRAVPLCDLLRHRRTAATQCRRGKQRLREIVPRVGAGLLTLIGKKCRGNPLDKIRGHVLVQIHVVSGDHTRRGRDHRREPPALFQACTQLPLREPQALNRTNADAHAPGANKTDEAVVQANDPVQVRRNGFPLCRCGRR